MDLKLVPSTIIESLDRSGSQRYEELLEKVGKLHDDLTAENFNEIIMEMEIQGLIRVQEMTRGNKRIELS